MLTLACTVPSRAEWSYGTTNVEVPFTSITEHYTGTSILHQHTGTLGVLPVLTYTAASFEYIYIYIYNVVFLFAEAVAKAVLASENLSSM